MDRMTRDQRRARIVALEDELKQLRAEERAEKAADAVLEKQLSPEEARALYLDRIWVDLRLGARMTRENFLQVIAACRDMKKTNARRAANHLHERTGLALYQAISIVQSL